MAAGDNFSNTQSFRFALAHAESCIVTFAQEPSLLFGPLAPGDNAISDATLGLKHCREHIRFSRFVAYIRKSTIVPT
jgi:hypothetical protein